MTDRPLSGPRLPLIPVLYRFLGSATDEVGRIMRWNVKASLSTIAVSALLAFLGPEAGYAAAPALPALPPTLPSATGPQEILRTLSTAAQSKYSATVERS